MLDTFHRPFRDLRISVTDRCNFRCVYCMPSDIFNKNYSFLPKKDIMTFEEIVRIVNICKKLEIKKVRLTGGEPLLRNKIEDLISMLFKDSGIEDIALTTNGFFLKQKSRLLYSAGLKRITVSLDSLRDEVFGKMNGVDVKVKTILEGIDAASNCGMKIKVNMLVKKNMNEDDILPMADYFKEKNIPLRFIEFMDVGNSNQWKLNDVFTCSEILNYIKYKYEFENIDSEYDGEVARRYRYKNSTAEFGIISSVSEPFCTNCSRLRLSANGKLFTCLFSDKGHDLLSLLRSDNTDEQVEEYVNSIWSKRNDRYSDERFENIQKGISYKEESFKKVEMSFIGG